MVIASSPHMPSIRPFSLVAILVASGCTLGSTPQPAYPQQMAWTGPPGGAIDPGYGYDGQGEPNGSYEGSYPPGQDDPSGQATPSADPQDPNYALGDVTDPEIDATLEGYGTWQEDEDYGRVWVPDATVVGEEFTPYDSSGEWAYTDYGWSFQSDWDWGWLPFHYGRWAQYEDGGWCWAPDHTWGASWVDWRHGGNVIGWNPTAPHIRDHRTHPNTQPGGGDQIRDHRTHKDPNVTWHFAATNEFGWRNRPHSLALGDGMRQTESVSRPPPGAYGGRAASLMGARLRGKAWTQTHPSAGVRMSGTRPNVSTGYTGGMQRPFSPYLGQSTAGGRPWMKPPSPWGTAQPGAGQRGSAPDYGTYRAPRQGFGQTQPTWGGGRGGYNPPPASTGWNTGGADRAPSRPSWNGGSPPSRPSWNPPSRPSGGWNTSGSFGAPQRPSFSSGGSRSSGGSSSGGGSRSYSGGSSGGSRSSGGGSSGGSRSSGGGSSGGGSRSSGGGGGRRR